MKFWVRQGEQCSEKVMFCASVCISASVFHGLQGGKREKQSQTESRQKGREEEEAGGGVLPEGERWNMEHAVLIWLNSVLFYLQ